MRRIVTCVIALLLLLPAAAPAAHAGEAPQGYEVFARNDALLLYGERESGNIILESRADGYRWYSNPPGNDKKAKGVHRQTLLSQLAVGYSNERGTALSLLSAPDAVRGGGLTMEQAENGMQVSYDFQKAAIRLNLRYELAADHLKVLLPVEGIELYPDGEGNPNLNSVDSVDILPVLGAGGPEQEGYLLVPDGSGALIHFNNGNTSMVEYNSLLYGKDHGVEGQIALTGFTAQQAATQEQPARMPVFGTYHGGEAPQGLFGIVTQNDAKARILARVSNLTSYNYAYSRFMLRTGGSMVMSSKEFGSSVIGVGERAGLTTGTYEVRYYPLRGEQANYAGMAAKYREYLMEEQGLVRRAQAGEYPLYVDAYGYVKKPAQILGIPYTKTVALTTAADLHDIKQSLSVPQTMLRYSQWMPGTAYERIPASATLLGALGKMDELQALDKELRAVGGGLYLSAELAQVYKAGSGFWAIRDAVLTPVNTPQLQYQLQYGTRAINMMVKPWYLLSPARYGFFFNRYYESFSRTGMRGLALTGIADICSSDNRSGGTGRGEVPGIVQGVLKDAGQELMLEGGHMYAAVLARHLLLTPPDSSRYSIADEAVPFYQMVLHGSLPYSIGLMNHAPRPRQLLLKCLEYGASPHYAFIGRNMEELPDTRMVWLLSPDYRAWAGEAKAVYEELSGVLAPLSQMPITAHRSFDRGSLTVYGGRTAIYVNYSDSEQALDGYRVPAEGYLVVEVN